MKLNGRRVRVREWQRSDSRALESWPPFNDPLDPIWNLPRTITISAFTGAEEAWSPERRTWTIETGSGQIVGRISLRDIDMKRSQARLGISLGSPFVSQGFGTEALSVFLNHYFGSLGFQLMVLDVAAPNVRAVRCYRRLGFRIVGDDWREVPTSVDLRFLDRSEYRPLHQFFRFGRHGTWVQFYEMELHKVEWSRQPV